MRSSTSNIKVITPGARLTVQDLGRRGSQKYGVSVSGVLDASAAIIANRLVGNPITSAVLESTFGGVSLEFDSESRVAVTGADVNVGINDVDMPAWETIIVPRSGVLSLSVPISGSHVYVAVAGGIDSPIVLGSRSTHVASGIGGMDGNAVSAGDVLPVGDEASSDQRPRAGTTPSADLRLSKSNFAAPIRAVPGPQYDLFTPEGQSSFWSSSFNISVRSDRQGMRLEGPTIEAVGGKYDIVSDAAYMGAVQIPGDGMPIVLLADRQSTGGYTKIASVIRADLSNLVQRQPGSEVVFEQVDIDTAEMLAREQHRMLFDEPLQTPSIHLSQRVVCNGTDMNLSIVKPSIDSSSSSDRRFIWLRLDESDDVAVEIDESE